MSKIKSANWEMMENGTEFSAISEELLTHYQKLANYYARLKGDKKDGENN